MDKRKVMMIDPRTMKIEVEETVVSFGVDLPAWWRKLIARFDGTDGHANYFSFKPGFIDHAGVIPQSDIVVGNPYRLSFDDFTTLRLLNDRYRVHVAVSGQSAYYPGHSLGVYLTPTKKSYELLRLKPGATAACVVNESAYADVGDWLR